MSLGFRCFLLILVCFGAAWVYRTQEEEIAVWLGLAEPTVPDLRGVPVGRSHVRDAMDLNTRVTVTLKGQALRSQDRAKPSRGILSPSLYAEEALIPPEWPEPSEDVIYEEREDESRTDDLVLPGLSGLSGLPEGEFPPAPEDGLAHEEGQRIFGDLAPDPKPEDDDSSPSADGGYVIHTVADKENLWKIAKKYLGKGHRHGEILELNPELGANGDKLYVGMEIKVPKRR